MSIGIESKSLKYFGNYIGKVISNDDPLKLGRIQVEIYPMYVMDAPKSKKLLPWAVPAMPLSVGAGLISGDPDVSYGSFFVPDVDSHVWCFFKAGDPYYPVYFAEATDGKRGLPSARVTNPDESEEGHEQYPWVRVVRTRNGIQIKINDFFEAAQGEDGEDVDFRSVRVDHPKGSWVEFYPDGRLTLHTSAAHDEEGSKKEGDILIETDAADINILAKKGDITAVANEGDIKVTADKGYIDILASEKDINIKAAKGDFRLNVEKGDATVSVGEGDLSVQVKEGDAEIKVDEGDLTVETGGDVDVDAGGNANIKASGNVKIEGALVQLN